LRCGVREHVEVHRWCHNDGATATQVHCEQKTVTRALYHAAQRLGRCWSDEEGVGPQAEFHVVRPGALLFAFSKVAVDPVVGKRSEGEGCDKFCGRFGHHDSDLCATALELTSEQGRFVGSDAACNAQKNAFVVQHGGIMTPPVGLCVGVRRFLGFFAFYRIVDADEVLSKLGNGDAVRLRQALIETRDLYLLSVFEHFFK